MAAESLGSESSSSRNLSCLGPSQPANTLLRSSDMNSKSERRRETAPCSSQKTHKSWIESEYDDDEDEEEDFDIQSDSRYTSS
ncbi:hypothetical protein Btru_038062 [Bulinus truncatus]|nr:hypothetical protein Btru_038062 [Bulinus truncatus]